MKPALAAVLMLKSIVNQALCHGLKPFHMLGRQLNAHAGHSHLGRASRDGLGNLLPSPLSPSRIAILSYAAPEGLVFPCRPAATRPSRTAPCPAFGRCRRCDDWRVSRCGHLWNHPPSVQSEEGDVTSLSD